MYKTVVGYILNMIIQQINFRDPPSGTFLWEKTVVMLDIEKVHLSWAHVLSFLKLGACTQHVLSGLLELESPGGEVNVLSRIFS